MAVRFKTTPCRDFLETGPTIEGFRTALRDLEGVLPDEAMAEDPELVDWIACAIARHVEREKSNEFYIVGGNGSISIHDYPTYERMKAQGHANFDPIIKVWTVGDQFRVVCPDFSPVHWVDGYKEYANSLL